MGNLKYWLNRSNLGGKGSLPRFYRRELELMTTHQLREICRQEKIIRGIVNPLDKEELIRTVLRYRGIADQKLITNGESDAWQRLQELVDRRMLHCQTPSDWKCSGRLIFYEGAATGYYDEFTMEYRKELEGTNACIVSDDQQLCAVVNLQIKGASTDTLYILRSAAAFCRESGVKKYNLLCFPKEESDKLYDFFCGNVQELVQPLRAYRIPLIDFQVRSLLELDLPVALEFGSNSTTAGVYLNSFYFEHRDLQPGKLGLKENDINYAIFYDVDAADRPVHMLPSVVAVASIEGEAASEPEITYLFGYEALRETLSKSNGEGFSSFFGIKRWIADYETNEEITDREGRRVFVPRRKILRAYFLHVVECVRDRFKCKVTSLHITSPMKYMYMFRKMLTEIIPEYKIDGEEMLDEGVAVLYNTISQMIDEGTLRENEEYRALLLDCGGRKTDLSAYTFRYENRRVAYKIDIDAVYINGDMDFGGNDLTYRIMQLLKLKLAEAVCGGIYSEKISTSVSELMWSFDVDIFRHVDEYGKDDLYKEIADAYREAENVIPTRFADWEKLSRDDYHKVKNNFWVLFEIAENVKKAFYNGFGTLQVCVADAKVKDALIETLVVDKWKISAFTENANGKLTTIRNFPTVYFNVLEIVMVLKGDIYGLMRKFIEPLYEDGSLDGYSLIKLAGQSCKIDIFRDALSEFVAGKIIKYRPAKHTLKADSDLKMQCLDGSLRYLRDKTYGLADISITSHQPRLPYVISAYTHTGKEVVLIDGLHQSRRKGSVSRNLEDLLLELFLKDSEGIVRYKFVYRCNMNEMHSMKYEEIASIYGTRIQQSETDSIENNEVKFFIWMEPMRWGYMLLPICRYGENLQLGREQFFCFENEVWIQNFFNGKK